ISEPDEVTFPDPNFTRSYSLGSLAPGESRQVSWHAELLLGSPLTQPITDSFSLSATADNAGSRYVEQPFMVPLLPDSSTECGLSVCTDTDGDGIWDNWESPGGGIDANYDGQIDLDLYALGARPNRKDIFVEIDYMSGQKPDEDALSDVRQAFDI